MKKFNWSKPYFGITHCGEFSTQKAWATVVDRGSFAELTKWFTGCGFNPECETFDTVEKAKKAGEIWLEKQPTWAGDQIPSLTTSPQGLTSKKL